MYIPLAVPRNQSGILCFANSIQRRVFPLAKRGIQTSVNIFPLSRKNIRQTFPCKHSPRVARDHRRGCRVNSQAASLPRVPSRRSVPQVSLENSSITRNYAKWNRGRCCTCVCRRNNRFHPSVLLVHRKRERRGER